MTRVILTVARRAGAALFGSNFLSTLQNYPEYRYVLDALNNEGRTHAARAAGRRLDGKKTASKLNMPNNHRNHRTTKPSAAKSLREVEFRFESPTAKSVHLAGDFNEWATNSLPLRKESPGQWRARVPLPLGPHQYRFVVDGLWVDDPTACRHSDNPFGSCNCEILVQ